MVRWCHENTSSDGHALDRPRRIPEAGGRAPEHFCVGLAPPDYRLLPGSSEEMSGIISRAEAIAHGLKRYFDGHECKNGHATGRFVSTGRCTQCQYDASKKWTDKNPGITYQYVKGWRSRNPKQHVIQVSRWAEKNPEKVLANQALYRDRNREKLREANRVYSEMNKEKVRESRRRYEINNRDKILESRRLYAEANREKILERNRKYRKAHPEKQRIRVINRRARIRGADGFHTAAEVADLLQKQKCKCAICRVSIKEGYHVDHIMPLVLGGSNWISNIQLACGPCNQRKHAKDPFKFAQENGRLL